MISETAPELISYLRNVAGVSVKLTAAGTVSIKPKKNLTEELKAAIARVSSQIRAVLEKERCPVDRDPKDTRPTLSGAVSDLKIDSDLAWDTIRVVNDPPKLFRCSGLVRIEHDDEGIPIVQRLDAPRLTHYLSQKMRWVIERQRAGTTVECAVPPPAKLVVDLLAKPEPPVPILSRIVTIPTVTRMETIHDRPGYDPQSGVFYEPLKSFTMEAVADAPTDEEIVQARDLLIEVVKDMPLVLPADRTHAVAIPLTAVARDLIEGPTPLFIFTKPAPGTGASLLCDVWTFLLTGRPPRPITQASDEEEWRKRITSLLIAAPTVNYIDNLRGFIDSASLSSVLTSTVWGDRILGKSETVSLPNRAVWIATGNNVLLSNELSRRCIPVSMDAGVERPWLRVREGRVVFTHPDLREWVRAERARLLRACLTLVRAWLARSRPTAEETMGSFEGWAQVLGGILKVAGLPGFLSNLDAFYSEGDTESDDVKRFLAAVWAEKRDHPVTTTELYSIATKPEVMLPLQGRDDAGRRVSLGHYLRQHRGRPYSISTVTGDAIEVRITKASPEGASHTAWRLKPSASLAGVSIPSHANFGVSITPWDAESAETRKTRGGVVEKPATPGREPGEDDPGLFASGTVTPKICSTCHCPRFWRSRAAVITCATCHPPAVETLVAQWIGPDDARRVRA